MESVHQGIVRGWLHRRADAPQAALALTHGAGADCESPLMTGLAGSLALEGWIVLRYDLPFRQQRPAGPPAPAAAALDREGIGQAVRLLRGLAPGVPLFCGGHSYGGRQTGMLATEDPQLADALLLLSYPLHPPRRFQELRTAHFPQLRVPALFVHGTRDPFGSIAGLTAAMALIPARTELLPLDRVGHDLKPAPQHARTIAEKLLSLI